MKKILVLLFFFFIPVVKADYQVTNYKIDMTILENGNIEVTEIFQMNGEYNGFERTIKYRNNYEGYKGNSLIVFDKQLYNGSDIVLNEIRSIEYSNKLTNEELEETGDLFNYSANATKGDYGVYKIDEFEGPLDLLLHLIKEDNIDIYDISIDKITKDYLDYINRMEELNINVASSYLVMSSELMEIKSKSLLPSNKKEENVADEEEVSRERLINKLIEYKKYKEITSSFKELESLRKEIYIKSPENVKNYIDEKITNDNDIGINDLLNAFSHFLERKKLEKPLNTKITNKEYSVKERKNNIRNILKERKKLEFTELFNEYNKSFIVVTFLSILEMTKDNEIDLKQEDNFSKIYIELKV